MRKWRTEKKRELRKEQQGIDLETEITKSGREQSKSDKPGGPP